MTVQTVMNLLGKAEASGQDPYLALLTYCSTPIDNSLPSPAQLPNHRDYPTQLPISERLQVLKPLLATQNNCRTDRTSREDSMIVDRHLNFENLYQGEEVVVFQPRTNTWTPEQVREEASDPRSFIVKTADGSAWAKMQWSTIQALRKDSKPG